MAETEAVATFANPHITFTQKEAEGALAPVETLTTTTDPRELVEAALSGDEESARAKPSLAVKTERSKDGRTITTTYEPEDSSRARYLQAVEQELAELGESETTEQKAPGEAEQQPKADEELMQRVREQAVADAVAHGRQMVYQQWQNQHFANGPQEYAAAVQQAVAVITPKLEQVTKNIPDFSERQQQAAGIINQNPAVAVAVRDAVLGIPGGEYAWRHIVTNPGQAESLLQNSPEVAAARVAELAATLRPKPQPTRTRSSSLAPTRATTGGGTTIARRSLDELPYAEFAAIRNRQEKERYRR